MTVGELLALVPMLRMLPASTEITTMGEHQPEAIEQAILASFDGGPVLVLGMEMAAGYTVDGAEIVWTAHDTAMKGIVRAQGEWAKAKREWVG